ncbi:acyl-CoA thioesterase [Glaciecola sp. 1036]|uniref:acyl-CoA thioesterase n=1 Tax=Alteromonadaceae TaxID=72275 RepID=UPI003D02E50C
MLECQLVGDDANRWHELNWQVNRPFIMLWVVQQDELDHYNHANNTVYVKKLEQLAWAHSASLGLSIEDYQRLDRAMVIHKHVIEYKHPCLFNEQVACATWISGCDKKFRLQRHFQFIATDTEQTVLTATTDYVCVSLASGKPKPMPAEFIETYGQNVIYESDK